MRSAKTVVSQDLEESSRTISWGLQPLWTIHLRAKCFPRIIRTVDLSFAIEALFDVVCSAGKVLPENVVKCRSDQSARRENVNKCYYLERKTLQFSRFLPGESGVDLTTTLPKPAQNSTRSCMILSEAVTSLAEVTNRPNGRVI